MTLRQLLPNKSTLIMLLFILLLYCQTSNKLLFSFFLHAQAEAAAKKDENQELPTAKDVSVSYCSMAEIYLTDLWYQSWLNW